VLVLVLVLVLVPVPAMAVVIMAEDMTMAEDMITDMGAVEALLPAGQHTIIPVIQLLLHSLPLLVMLLVMGPLPPTDKPPLHLMEPQMAMLLLTIMARTALQLLGLIGPTSLILLAVNLNHSSPFHDYQTFLFCLFIVLCI